jgi:hypothetical protein
MILAMLCLFFAAFAKENIKDEKKENKALPEKAKQKEKDPFNMEYLYNGEDSFIPLERNSLPPGICVLGIIIKDKSKRLAIISIPGYKNSFFVREGAVIRLDGRERKKLFKRNTNEHENDVYLEILEISSHEVKLVQKQRPDQVYSIR